LELHQKLLERIRVAGLHALTPSRCIRWGKKRLRRATVRIKKEREVLSGKRFDESRFFRVATREEMHNLWKKEEGGGKRKSRKGPVPRESKKIATKIGKGPGLVSPWGTVIAASLRAQEKNSQRYGLTKGGEKEARRACAHTHVAKGERFRYISPITAERKRGRLRQPF